MTGLQDGWDISKFMEVLERPANQGERRVRSKVYSRTRKPQARIEKEVGHFLGDTKKPTIYFQIPGCGTKSRKNLKAIYRQLEPLFLA